MRMNPLHDVPVEATVDGIKIHYEDGEVEVTYDVSDGDVVRLTIEPLEVKVTDGFRAAVKKACNCDSSSGGGSGGGALVVHEVDGALDKTYKQIVDALHANGVILEWTHEDGSIEVYLVIDYGNVNNVYLITFHTDSATSSAGGKSLYYVAESKSDFPTYEETK